MTNPDYTHVTLVVDRSGSMSADREESQAGINTLIAEQFALDGKLTVTLSQFDNTFETAERMRDSAFTYELEPRGMTALLDAVGMEVVRTGEDLAALPEFERPGRVLLVVVTDGHENSSHEYTLAQVRQQLDVQKSQFGWEVQFLGADDAVWQGAELGVKTTRFSNDAAGKTAVYAEMSASLKTYRGMPDNGGGFVMPDQVGSN
ncbi:MAG: VWA domain-containing protein [Knoellia sp.]